MQKVTVYTDNDGVLRRVDTNEAVTIIDQEKLYSIATSAESDIQRVEFENRNNITFSQKVMKPIVWSTLVAVLIAIFVFNNPWVGALFLATGAIFYFVGDRSVRKILDSNIATIEKVAETLRTHVTVEGVEVVSATEAMTIRERFATVDVQDMDSNPFRDAFENLYNDEDDDERKV